MLLSAHVLTCRIPLDFGTGKFNNRRWLFRCFKLLWIWSKIQFLVLFIQYCLAACKGLERRWQRCCRNSLFRFWGRGWCGYFKRNITNQVFCWRKVILVSLNAEIRFTLAVNSVFLNKISGFIFKTFLKQSDPAMQWSLLKLCLMLFVSAYS